MDTIYIKLIVLYHEFIFCIYLFESNFGIIAIPFQLKGSTKLKVWFS